MVVGIPKSISRILKPLKYNPKVIKLYYIYLKLYCRTKSFLKINLTHQASVNPYRLYNIDPSTINHEMKEVRSVERYFFSSPIKDGDWDLNDTEPIENNELYEEIRFYVKNDIWPEDTGLSEKRRSRLSKLVNDIRENGYKKQKNLNSGENAVRNVERIDYFLNEFNEVTINIGRNGQKILETGHHRFFISRALGLNQLPCRISIRHKEWQIKRNKYSKDKNKINGEYKNHPDIYNLCNLNSAQINFLEVNPKFQRLRNNL